MTKRKIIVSLVASLLIIIAGAGMFNYLSKQKKSNIKTTPVEEAIVYVTTESFATKTVNSKIEIDGRLNAFQKITLSAEANGKLEDVGKVWREGSYFKKGDLLFRAESTDERLSLFAQRSSLLNAITQIMPDLKFDYPDAFQKWKTYLDNFEIENRTPDLPAIENQQEKYYVAGKNIYNLYYSIKSAEERLNNFSVYAPFSGVFMQVNTYPGSLVSPGTQLASIMNSSQYELQAPISMENFNLIKVGQQVSLREEALNKNFKGTISRIGRQIDQTTQSIPVYIAVAGIGLRDGMYLKGELAGNSIKDVTALPLQAIVNQNQIYVLEEGSIREKSVELVLRMDDQILVRGVDSTEKIIIKGLNSLSPGQKATEAKI